MLSKNKVIFTIVTVCIAGLYWPAAGQEPEKLRVLGLDMTIKIDGQKTGGAMTVLDTIVPPGGGPPMHIHSREDELFYVIEGRFKFWHGDHAMEIDPGGVVFLPRNGRHTYQNVGTSPGRLLTIITPAGFEGFFREVAKRDLSVPKDIKELNVVANEYGLQFLGPPPRP